MMEFPAAGLRDARLGPIGGGTTEIMKEVIGRPSASDQAAPSCRATSARPSR